jgi:DNA-directed RNA polymerase specialized sigma24 family protein
VTTLSADANPCEIHGQDRQSEQVWSELYPQLRSLARRLVYSYHVPFWRGQEEDFTDDIVQETIRRAIERVRQSERGESAPIYALKPMLFVILCNYCKDLRRRDMRLVHLWPGEGINEGQLPDAMSDEDVANQVYNEGLFRLLAQEIASFPKKQQRALLIDLASRTHYDEEPTTLQEAFLAVGIDLREYQHLLPDSVRERCRHSSLLCHAYKRVAHLLRVREYVSGV